MRSPKSQFSYTYLFFSASPPENRISVYGVRNPESDPNYSRGTPCHVT